MLELSNEVSLGDLFTGVSILLSATGIAISQMYERKKTSRIARVTALESSVQSLSKALIIGLKLAERLKWARFEKDTVSDKEIVNFGFGLENRIVLAKHSAFALWATKQERDH